ncbi:MAG: hypothetical protein HYT78_16895 [Deltaproteobacteria bacterium]|nr:hypothetical protein [Deltaproteobacteria bacterium]
MPQLKTMRGVSVTPMRAKVIECNCVECRDVLVEDCRKFELPLPTDPSILVPERWASHRCPHRPGGLVLEFETEQASKTDADEDAKSPWWNFGEEIEAPASVPNLDATKGIGYPARETGRYGSHPSHDGFDDESWS